jgi:hypothetical protein
MITLTIDDFAKQMKWMFLLLYFCPNVKKSFLLKVSFVDSREKITKYVLSTLGAWQMQKKNPKYNIVLSISTPTLVGPTDNFRYYAYILC